VAGGWDSEEDKRTMKRPNLQPRIRQLWAACKGFLVKRWPWVLAVSVPLFVGILYAFYWWPWAGFGGYTDSKGEWQREKTLWDWLGLLLVPLLLAAGAWLLNRAAREREHKTELDRSRQAALQTYLDRVSALLRDRWRESGKGFLEANIIRAQTLTILRQLDGERKGLLLQFLYESGLVGTLNQEGERQEALVDLSGANLSGADLSKADLRGADLRGVDLGKADLNRANLYKAYLRGADLSEAWLIIAYLCEADLREAKLSGAKPIMADLREADLRWARLAGAKLGGAWLDEADLRGAYLYNADLREADLRDAKLSGADLSRADLREAKLSGTDLSRAKLIRANLSRASLYRANLYNADLRGADLRRAYLHGADLAEADMGGADLRGAVLVQAKLTEAILGVAKLHGASLQRADLIKAAVTKEQLAEVQTLEDAILPDGTRYTSETEPEPAPAETGTDNAEGQPDQPGDYDASEGVEGSTSA
jgi:uncharacterized protein YjbI with pentapeptide repeats